MNITTVRPAGLTTPAFDRTALLSQLRGEMRNAVAFTAQAHHGWGGDTPVPTPPPAEPVPGSTPQV